LNIIDKNSTKPWKDIVPLLSHKGIRIHPEKNTFYLSRVDEEQEKARMIHKFYKNKKLTQLLRLRIRSMQTNEDLQLKEIVVEKNKRLFEIKKEHLRRYKNGNDRILLYEEEGDRQKEYNGDTKISDLQEEKEYVTYV